MSSDSRSDQRELLAHVIVPVSNEEDARKTAESLEPYNPERVTALHVVEKEVGVPDKTPVDYSEEVAEASYAAVRGVFPDANDEIAYARDIVEAIFETADEVDASAIAYRSRGGGRLLQFLSGDPSLELVTQAERPIIALPRAETDP